MITRQELKEKVDGVLNTAPHTEAEWNEAYMDLAMEAADYWEIQERLEQAVLEKYGIKELAALYRLHDPEPLGFMTLEEIADFDLKRLSDIGAYDAYEVAYFLISRIHDIDEWKYCYREFAVEISGLKGMQSQIYGVIKDMYDGDTLQEVIGRIKEVYRTIMDSEVKDRVQEIALSETLYDKEMEKFMKTPHTPQKWKEEFLLLSNAVVKEKYFYTELIGALVKQFGEKEAENIFHMAEDNYNIFITAQNIAAGNETKDDADFDLE